MPNFDHPEPKQVTRAKRTADAFRRNDTYEHLLRLRDSGDAAWQQTSTAVRIAAAMYENDRATHQQITGGTA